MRNSNDVIEIDKCVILNTLQNKHFQEYSIYTKSMPNLISNYLRIILFWLQNILILIGMM